MEVKNIIKVSKTTYRYRYHIVPVPVHYVKIWVRNTAFLVFL
jgi:hypothetical protein